MAAQMQLVDRQLLNVIQSSFPLVSQPFNAIGEQVHLAEEEVIRRIAALKKRNVVRQISAIFDARRLGYKTSLVAMRLPTKSLTKAAHHINRHPGVSHNYARNGYFNLWFTLAVPPCESLEETMERMAQETEAEAFRIMPTIRFFKLNSATNRFRSSFSSRRPLTSGDVASLTVSPLSRFLPASRNSLLHL